MDPYLELWATAVFVQRCRLCEQVFNEICCREHLANVISLQVESGSRIKCWPTALFREGLVKHLQNLTHFHANVFSIHPVYVAYRAALVIYFHIVNVLEERPQVATSILAAWLQYPPERSQQP